MNQKAHRTAPSITTSRRIIDKWLRIDKETYRGRNSHGMKGKGMMARATSSSQKIRDCEQRAPVHRARILRKACRSFKIKTDYDKIKI